MARNKGQSQAALEKSLILRRTLCIQLLTAWSTQQAKQSASKCLRLAPSVEGVALKAEKSEQMLNKVIYELLRLSSHNSIAPLEL